MLYTAYELGHAALMPLRNMTALGVQFWQSPLNPAKDSLVGRTSMASLNVLESLTRRYSKPAWDITHTLVQDKKVPLEIKPECEKDFGRLLHFVRDEQSVANGEKVPPARRVLIVAPMSGHYATLLRGTVQAMLPQYDVYITDWADARHVPVSAGRFDLNTYIDYLIAFMAHIGPKTHTMAVCQPGPALLAAIAYMSDTQHPALPASMTLMGSPIDARKSPTETNLLAEEKDPDWFASAMIQTVPPPHMGAFRRVYPGFLQLFSFMSMNRERHISAHQDYFNHLVQGDGDSAAKHRKFYDEYLAVCDMTEEFYLQTIRDVFQEYRLPCGTLKHHGRTIEPAAIRNVALMTVEGELDDISGIGQTQAAHDLCTNIPPEYKTDYIQKGVGHYGVFNGSKWRTQIQPKIHEFMRNADHIQQKNR